MSAAAPAHVVIVGGGPAGLSAACALRARGVAHVTVLDREQEMGGVPRHTDHLGYGLRDLHRLTSGPRYARLLTERAHRAGAELRPGTTAIDVRHSPGSPTLVHLATGEALSADAVVLSTGVRERPRAARLVPGDRPAGVFTTGSVQQLTSTHHLAVGRRAVVVGAEHVSFSAIWSLAHGGCTTVAMVTEHPRHQTVPVLRWITAGVRRVPVHTGAAVADIVGRHRVEAVVLDDGRRIECDTVVFTGSWVPEYELARAASLAMIPSAKGPAVDRSLRTSAPGVFAIGNLVHPAEPADRCSLDGVVAADAVVSWLADRRWPDAVEPIAVEDPLAWASWCAGMLTARVSVACRGRLQLQVDGAPLVTGRLRRLDPTRALVLRGNALASLATGSRAALKLGIVR